MRTQILAASAALLAACQPLAPPPPSDVGLWPDAAGDTYSPPLSQACEAHWDGYLAAYPELATAIGDPRFNGRVTDLSPVGRQERRDALWFVERRVVAIEDAQLVDDERLTRDLLLREVRTESELLEAGVLEWSAGRALDLLVSTTTLPEVQPVRTERERDQLLARWSAVPDALRRCREGLAREANLGRVAPTAALQHVVAVCDRMLAAAPMDHPMVRPATGGGRWVDLAPQDTLTQLAARELGDPAAQLELRRVNRHLQRGEVRALGTRVLIPAEDDTLDPDQRGQFLEAVLRIVEDEVQPAIAALRATIVDDLLPRARDPQRAGLVHQLGGRDLYWLLLARELGEGVASEADYAAVMDELARLELDVAADGREVLGAQTTAQLREALARDTGSALRGSDSVLATLEARAREVRPLLPRWFGGVPATGYRVEPVWEALSGDVDAFTYLPGGERAPARLFVDAERLAGRSLYEVRALALAELLPGRHLWRSSALENSALPRFRRHLAPPSSGDGFGLYVLAVGEELGLLESAGDRLGARLVRLRAAALAAMDFAVHHDGWGRRQALDFLRARVPHAAADLEVELDLVLARPGRAFSAWIMSDRLNDLYRGERTAAGPGFDAGAFHRRLLAAGPVPAGYLSRAFAARP